MSPFVSLIVLILFIPIALSDEYPRLLNCLKQEEAEINKCERSKTCIIIVDRRHATIDVSIDWVMKDFKTGAIVTIPYEYNHNERFVLKPYTAKPAMYVIQAIMTLNGNIVPDMNRCYFFVPARNPIAVITGGETRSVCGWQQFVVSGQESMDVDTRVNEEVHLSYKWSCNQKLATNNFCKKDPVSSDATVTVPATHAMPDEIFSFTLEVTTESGLSAVTAQEVYVGETDMTVITIRCQRNCPPVSETSLGNSPTLLYATCDANCKGIKDEDYIWKVNATDFNCEQHTEFGCDHPKLLVKKDVLKPGVYGFAVSLKDGRPVKAGAVVIVAAPPEGVTCEINPNSGDALQTWHKLKCKYPAEDSHTFELFVQDVTGDMIATYRNPAVDKSWFQLPESPNGQYVVKVTAANGAYIVIEMKADIKPLLSEIKDPKIIIEIIEQLYNRASSKINETVEASLSFEERQRFISVLQSLIDEVIKVKNDDEGYAGFIKSLKYRVVEDLMKLPLSSLEENLLSAESIGKIMSYKDDDKVDPALAKFATSLCKKMAEKNLELMKEERFPLDSAEKAHKFASNLNDCVNANLEPNMDILKPIPHFNVTTAKTSVDVPTITENYGDYQDYDEKYYKNVDDLQEATYNIINATSRSAKVLAMGTAVGDKIVRTKHKRSRTVVAKDLGYALAKTQIKSEKVSLIPSQDWAESDHPFDILLISWSSNLIWWDPDKADIKTYITHLEFWHSTCKEQVTQFEKPVELFLELKNGTEFDYKTVEETLYVAENFTELSEEQLNRQIRVRRMGCIPHQAVMISFGNLTEEIALDVVVTRMKFPTIQDFAEKRTITAGSNNSDFLCRSEMHEDIWCYVGVLPNKEMLPPNNEAKSWTYSLSVFSVSCATWKLSTRTWVPSCNVGENSGRTMVHCSCTHFSIVTAVHDTVTPQLMIVGENIIGLEAEVNYTIFIFLCSTFLIYIIFCLLVSSTRKASELYYLADNHEKDLYAYLLVIRTGRWLGSGTTSNVVIRIFGNKRNSLPHVLNYPDPKLRILQRSAEDWFILTTNGHLGILRKLDLWFDSIGPEPSWYCESITIYDLQTQDRFYFSIHTRLSVIRGVTRITVKAFKPKKNKRRVSWKELAERIIICDDYHTWHLGGSYANFSNFKRLTVLLSTITTTNALVLLMYGLPSLLPKDVLDRYGYYDISQKCFTISCVSALISFLIHITLAWIFRFSKVQFAYTDNTRGKCKFQVTVICWTILLCLLVLTFSILIIFGFWVPYMTGYLWLSSCLFAIFVDITIYENIILLLKNLFFKLEEVQHTTKRIPHVTTLTESQRPYLYRTFGQQLLRPYLTHLYKPIEHPQRKIMIEESRRSIVLQLQDLVMFGIYILILYLIVLSQRDAHTVVGRNEIMNMLTGHSSRTFLLEEIGCLGESLTYINQTYIPALQSSRWYGNFVINDPGMMIDQRNKYMGVARLRQERVEESDCFELKGEKFVGESCAPEFSTATAETDDFGYFWKEPTTFFRHDRLRDMWKYMPPSETGVRGFDGIRVHYSGGGYVVPLGRTMYNSYENLRIIQNFSWLNTYTRGLFVEVLIYSADYNMFYSSTVVIEGSATGYFSTSVMIYPMRMLYVKSEMALMNIIIFAMFVTWLFFLFVIKSLGIIRNFRTFYKNFWLMCDLMIILLSIVNIVIFEIRRMLVHEYLQEMEVAKHNEFISYFNMFYVGEILEIFSAILLCVATARIWKLVRFGLIFRIMERTLVIASTWLLTVFLFHLILLFSFAFSGWMLFSTRAKEFSTFNDIFASLVIITASLLTFFNTHMFADNVVTVCYFTFLAYSMLVITFFYVVIIMMSYVKAQEEFSSIIETYTVQRYIQERLMFLPKQLKITFDRLKGGQETVVKPLITAKATEFQYANCVFTSKFDLDMMHFIAQCLLRNRLQTAQQQQVLTKHDIYLMSRITSLTIGEEAEEERVIFYKGHFKNEEMQLVPEERIVVMSKLAEFLVNKGTKQKKVSRVKKLPRNVAKCVKILRKNLHALNICDTKLRLLYLKINNIEI